MSERSDGDFQGMRGPRLPPDLRGRVLAAAAAAVTSPSGSWIDRVWDTRGWRVPLALSLALLAGAHLALSWLPAPRSPGGSEEALAWWQELTMVRAVDDWRRLERLLERGDEVSR